ncbi:helix-turn-helix transcriptional regulator [Kitasatospora sp. NBC_01287]|uniref:helix-turn-helix domain-containing protein n=1 Tax=Kitasatospora sp. NBC_01287 TaxID=2903573 RepID=UPI002252687D|nr:helix-turn-helix transcriptional regulator [Kitasatospora sp. NBC_01287]MCX4751605.1 helix-turn-helix transcriptional regulator [Kitasatospora sp. NBC_01287]
MAPAKRTRSAPVDGSGPTFLGTLLGQLFRDIREENRATREDIAEILDVSVHAVARLETAENRGTVPQVHLLCSRFKVPAETAEYMESLARRAKQRGWWSEYDQLLGGPYSKIVAVENLVASSKTGQIRTWEPDIFPGLFQAPDYIRALFEQHELLAKSTGERPWAPVGGVPTLDEQVESRKRRALILDGENPPMVWAIIGEGAFRKQIGGPDVMRKQLQHLLELSQRRNITIQIMKDDAGYHPGVTGPFTHFIFSKAADHSVVYHEGPSSFGDNINMIARHDAVFRQLQATAISLVDARSYLLHALS